MPDPQPAPWMLNSITLRMLVVAVLGMVAHLGHKVFTDSDVAAWTDFAGNVMTVVGIAGAWWGRMRTQKQAAVAIAHAAATGEVTTPGNVPPPPAG